MNEKLKGVWRVFEGCDFERRIDSGYPNYLVISENSVDFYEGEICLFRKEYKDDDFSTVFSEKTHNCISSDGQVAFFFLDKSEKFIACRKTDMEGIEKDLEWKDIFPSEIDMSKSLAEQILNGDLTKSRNLIIEFFKWSSEMSEDGTMTLTKGDKQKNFKLISDNGETPVWENLEDGLFAIRAYGEIYMYNLSDETIYSIEKDPDRYVIWWPY